MKKVNKLFIYVLIITMFITVFTGCSDPKIEDTPKETPGETEIGIYKPGTYSTIVKGFGGDVSVTITVDENNITDVIIVGENETPGIGSHAIEVLTESIKESVDIDIVSGATVTSTSVKNALAILLSEAKGEDISAVKMNDGTYNASALGFDLRGLVPVTVKISDNKIVDIVIGENGETNGYYQSVEKYMIPRIIENQSINVDAVTGATVTSNAVLQGIQDCLIQSGVDLAAMFKEIPKSTNTEEYDVDVVVVGLGGSGMTAALSAAENGAKVMTLEKAAKIGGTSAVTSGPMSVNAPSHVASEVADWPDPFTGEKRIKKAGEQLVDADALYKEWVEYTTVDGVQEAKIDIIKDAIYRSGETVDWLTGYGFEFEPATGFLGGKWSIFSRYKGNKALTEDFFENALNKYANELGGQYLLETEATELITKDGKVVGVKAVKYDGTEVIVNAKSVILATGGFGGSDELMKKYLGESWKLYGSAQNDGAGIKMATSVGAATYNIDVAPMSHFSAPPVIMTQFESAFDNDIPYGMVATGEILAVNKDGERFVNEMAIGLDAYLGGSRYYTIYSKEQIDTLREEGFGFTASGRYLNRGGIEANTPMANIDAVLSKGVELGYIYKADSLEKLAEQIGSDTGKMPKDTLLSTVEEYNIGVETGSDSMGKAADRFERLGSINTDSEYYIAVTGAPYIYSTCGGLDVNKNMQVLNTNGEEIEGLYAAGTDSMGVLFTNKKGYTNFGGVAQGYCFVSGRIAGEHAAAK
ncbi:MAG: FAD-dependent oxidoreductase [Tissierellia bacterium]|nr:FAD-dependent oxidoreductase [Tissierellia bacterium]